MRGLHGHIENMGIHRDAEKHLYMFMGIRFQGSGLNYPHPDLHEKEHYRNSCPFKKGQVRFHVGWKGTVGLREGMETTVWNLRRQCVKEVRCS